MNSTFRMYLAAGAVLGVVMAAVSVPLAQGGRGESSVVPPAEPSQVPGAVPGERTVPEPERVGPVVRGYAGLRIEVTGAGQAPYSRAARTGRGRAPAPAAAIASFVTNTPDSLLVTARARFPARPELEGK